MRDEKSTPRLAGRWFDLHREPGHWWFRFAGAGMGWASLTTFPCPVADRWQSPSTLYVGRWSVWFFVPWQREALRLHPEGVWIEHAPPCPSCQNFVSDISTWAGVRCLKGNTSDQAGDFSCFAPRAGQPAYQGGKYHRLTWREVITGGR